MKIRIPLPRKVEKVKESKKQYQRNKLKEIEYELESPEGDPEWERKRRREGDAEFPDSV